MAARAIKGTKKARCPRTSLLYTWKTRRGRCCCKTTLVLLFVCSSVPLFFCSSVPLFLCSSVLLFFCSSVPLFFCSSVLLFTSISPPKPSDPPSPGISFLTPHSIFLRAPPGNH